MKTFIRSLFATTAILMVALSSCKKNDSDSSGDDQNNKISVQSDDQGRFSNSINDVTNDAVLSIGAIPAFSGRGTETTTDICNASTVLDSTATDRRLVITYNGPSCYGYVSRNGTVTLTMPLGQHFSDVGATLTATYTNLIITRLSDGKSITINGSHTITNVTGGRIWELASLGTIIYDINSPGMNITFEDGTTRTWQVARRRTYSMENNSMVVSITGTHTEGTTENVSEWGTTRYGNPFTASINSPLQVRQSCDFRLTGGQVTYDFQHATVVGTFGLNSAGEPTTCPGLGNPYYCKLVWTGSNGLVYTVIVPY